MLQELNLGQCLIIFGWNYKMYKSEKPLTKQQTKDKALRLLEFRSHSEKELRDKLVRAGGQDIDEIIDFCKEYNFINDTAYAKALACDLHRLKKFGKKRIEMELKHKGIDTDDIYQALSELEETNPDELLLMIEKRLKGNFEQKNIQKTIRYFCYRGYEFSQIQSCIEKIRSDD